MTRGKIMLNAYGCFCLLHFLISGFSEVFLSLAEFRVGCVAVIKALDCGFLLSCVVIRELVAVFSGIWRHLFFGTLQYNKKIISYIIFYFASLTKFHRQNDYSNSASTSTTNGTLGDLTDCQDENHFFWKGGQIKTNRFPCKVLASPWTVARLWPIFV